MGRRDRPAEQTVRAALVVPTHHHMFITVTGCHSRRFAGRGGGVGFIARETGCPVTASRYSDCTPSCTAKGENLQISSVRFQTPASPWLRPIQRGLRSRSWLAVLRRVHQGYSLPPATLD